MQNNKDAEEGVHKGADESIVEVTELSPLLKDAAEDIEEDSYINLRLGVKDTDGFYNVTNYLNLRLISGHYSALIDIDDEDASHVVAVQFKSNIRLKKKFTILEESVQSWDTNLIAAIKKKLNSIARLENDDWEKVLSAIKLLDEYSIITEVDTLDSYIKISDAKDGDRRAYKLICQHVATNMQLFASVSANNFDKSIHFGAWLDKSPYIFGRGKGYLAIRTDYLYRSIFLKTREVQDASSNKAYNDYKYGLKSLGVIKWNDTDIRDGCVSQTLGSNKKDWCILFNIIGRSKVDKVRETEAEQLKSKAKLEKESKAKNKVKGGGVQNDKVF
ncbi:MAG TPA: hypothetical protein VIK26_05215 [Clostridium sp.]